MTLQSWFQKWSRRRGAKGHRAGPIRTTAIFVRGVAVVWAGKTTDLSNQSSARKLLSDTDTNMYIESLSL